MLSGTYNYFLNGKPTGITETFRIELLSNKEKHIFSERDASVFGTTITVNAKEKDGNFKNAEITFKNAETEVKAVYEFAIETFRFKREINGEILDDETFELPEKCIFFPLVRCFQGQIVLQVAINQGFTTVLVPDIQNPKDIQNLLKPTFDERTAEFRGNEIIAFYQPQSVSIETKKYSYLSKHYDENSRFWLNEEGLLVAYRFHQADDKIWEIHLD